MSELITVVSPMQSEKMCTGCYFNHGEDDITCHKFNSNDHENTHCYDEERKEHLIFKLDKQA